MVTETVDGLDVRWTAPSNSSSLIYTVLYDTIPPSPDGSLFIEDGINNLSITIPTNNLVPGRNCSVGVRALDERTGLYGAWSYAGTCSVGSTVRPDPTTVHPVATVRPEPPSVTNEILTNVNLFELKWSPPTSINRFISNYTIELANVTAAIDDCDDLCNDRGIVVYEYSFTVEPDCNVYREVITVTENTCFCAIVTAWNEAGYQSEPTYVSKFYERTIKTPPVTEANRAIMNDCDMPIVAIILAIVLIIVAIVALVLGIIFCSLYNSQRQARGTGSSSKNSY